MKTLTTPIGLIAVFVCIARADIPLPEHPRPDFQRSAWLNLNGAWQFDFDPHEVGEKEQWHQPGGRAFTRQIIVPFPWESRLSGIGDTEYKGAAWYARKVQLPTGEAWDARDCWLIVGACDWEAKVWVDGRPAGEHVGGYVPFEVNLTRFARPGQEVTIVIRAEDKTDPQQPSGKQVGWYTRNSGIWQTVYLEPRPKSFIRSIRGRADLANHAMHYDVELAGADDIKALHISSPEKEFKTVTRAFDKSQADGSLSRLTIPINQPQSWSPESPKLYPVRFTLLGSKGDALDTVDSYFGMREVSVGPAPGGDYQYIYLNGKPVYLRGLLHQSFHPEGIYQYPDDAAIRGDYELCKQTGINFVRIHIKVPIPRELYWADKLGILIMEDIPCYWKHTPIAQQWWEETMRATVARDFNHPSIFSWVNFNETWGIGDGGYKTDRQEWVEAMYHLTKQLDPTRLVEDNSPCYYDHVITDINSWHFYINNYEKARARIQTVVDKTFPGSTFNYTGGRKQGREPLINSEYGGIGADLGDQDVSWCFKFLTNELRRHDKICGYVYTELCDIEWEHNGFVNYDRTPKQFGYEFWHPGMTLADLNGADFVVIDAPPLVELKPGQEREIPIRISHWSDRTGKHLTLRYRTDWMDGFGRRKESSWQTRPAKWEPFKVVDQANVTVSASPSAKEVLGALQVELLDNGVVIARNYINLLVDRGDQPRIQGLGDDELAIRFAPMDFAECPFHRTTTRQELSVDKIAFEGPGRLEYRLRLPETVGLEGLEQVSFRAELSSRSGERKLDWPGRKNARSYPQTETKTWPSEVVLYINEHRAGTVLLPDDPADSRGVLSHRMGYQGSYGTLVNMSIEGPAIDKIRQSLSDDRLLRIRLEVPSDSDHPGGLAVYGQNAGCYPLDPTVVLRFEDTHGLAGDYRSDQTVAFDRAMHILLANAELPNAVTWRYTTDKPVDAWTAADFDDSEWKTGKGGFGVRKTEMAIVTTPWDTPDIWLRAKIDLEDASVLPSAQWRVYHDDDAEIYVNGIKVLELPGREAGYIDVPLDAPAVEAFRKGANIIAVHCKQIDGKQNIDVGLIAHRKK